MQIAPFNLFVATTLKPAPAAVPNAIQPVEPESQSTAAPATDTRDRSRTVPGTNAAAEKSPRSADQDHHDAANTDDPVK